LAKILLFPAKLHGKSYSFDIAESENDKKKNAPPTTKGKGKKIKF